MKKTVKGFTLIELIVVLATFSIIMFGALNLMTPVSKIMTHAEVQESGNAAVTNIASYLDLSLSPAKYMVASNVVPTVDTSSGALAPSVVNQFASRYCEGVLKNDPNSTPDTPVYANATIRMLVIDNKYVQYLDKDGNVVTNQADAVKIDLIPGKNLITEYTFRYNGSTKLTTYSSMNTETVNKAYLTENRFEIKPGTYHMVNDFDAAGTASAVSMKDLVDNMNTRGLCMTIKASTYRNKQWYNFVNGTSLALVNINNTSAVENYYEVGVNASSEKVIQAKVLTGSPMVYSYVATPPVGSDGLCFVYCYPDDIEVE